jgi:hypothetical protein
MNFIPQTFDTETPSESVHNGHGDVIATVFHASRHTVKGLLVSGNPPPIGSAVSIHGHVFVVTETAVEFTYGGFSELTIKGVSTNDYVETPIQLDLLTPAMPGPGPLDIAGGLYDAPYPSLAVDCPKADEPTPIPKPKPVRPFGESPRKLVL